MGGAHQGRRRRWQPARPTGGCPGAGLVMVLGMLAGCGGAPRPVPAPVPPVTAPGVVPPQIAIAEVPPPPPGLGPEVLLPAPDAVDREVARIGDVVLRQSHAYARLLSAHPKLALSAVDLLVFDVLVARHAQQFDIRLDPARVEALAAAEEQQIRQQVRDELGPGLDFAGYVARLFGMRVADWQHTLRLRTAQRLYQGYVLRYLALREDRVQVRFLVQKEEKVAEDVAEKVRAGADFGTMALRWSEDPSRRDGGLLPAFGRGFEHPVAQVAFDLQPGEVSAPFRARWGDEQRWFVVFCVDRMAGRELPFAAVRDEIDRDLEQRPLSNMEITTYTLRWRGGADAAANPAAEPQRAQ